VEVGLLFGFDESMARAWMDERKEDYEDCGHGHEHEHGGECGHGKQDHRSEVECISVTLTSAAEGAGVDMNKLEGLLKSAPKDEVFRIKAVLYANGPPEPTNGAELNGAKGRSRYILNWSFGRWTWAADEVSDAAAPILRMSVFTAQYESNKWMKRIESGDFISLSGSDRAEARLEVRRVR
jgi:hypothetical protein